jgi:AAA+ superfamily predicted ATPase
MNKQTSESAKGGDAGLAEFAQIAGTKVSDSDRYDGHREPSTGSSGALKCYSNESPAFFPMGSTIDKLEAGVYAIEQHHQRGIFFQSKDVKLDELMILPDGNCEKVLKGIQSFWEKEAAFRAHKFLWKRGLLLWGAPGSGKTSLLQLLSRDIVARDGLALFAESPNATSKALEMLRKIEPVRPVVVILEDLDAIVKEYGEAQLLALLDGEVQIDNVVYIATTNYPEMLDKRLINRPSRFDEIIKIDMPTAEARAFYLTKKSPRLANNIKELAKWVDQTKGMSVAHLRELIASVECLGHDFEVVMHRLKLMNRAKSSSERDEKTSMGFTSDVD